MKVAEHISLKEYTTFKIGGEARYFVRVNTVEELREAIAYAHKRNLPFFILGGGSNILVSDTGFPGLVIKVEIGGIEECDLGNGMVELSAGAGVVWDDFVAYAVQKGLYGIETLSLIPGSVGAAPVQNIGAYGAEAKDTLAWVEVLDSTTAEVKKMTNALCEFGYRDSIFKKPHGKHFVITRVAFALTKHGTPNTEYKDIKRYLEKNPDTEITLETVRNMVIDIRTHKLPDLNRFGTAGSFFKNPIISKKDFSVLVERFPEMPNFPVADPDMIKVSAAWILDNVCGFKGYRDGEVGVYENQALVLVNFGHATSDDVTRLAEEMIASVKEKIGIVLEKEVQVV